MWHSRTSSSTPVGAAVSKHHLTVFHQLHAVHRLGHPIVHDVDWSIEYLAQVLTIYHQYQYEKYYYYYLQ